MVFLAPALLALAIAVAVPLALHLLQRHQGPRVVFPALRYLRRAEREHATRIRLRQILLLALRVLALLLLAAAAARPFVRGGGQGHPPTVVVIILDNSLSTGAVVGDRRILDELEGAALQTLDALGAGDRVWLIRAGSPWDPAVTGDAATVAEAVRRTEPWPARADLTAELQRAVSILDLEPPGLAREIHLLSDLQASSFASGDLVFADGAPDPGDDAAPAVVVYAPDAGVPANRGVGAVEIGGGLPPRAGQSSTVAVTVTGVGDPEEPGEGSGTGAYAGGDSVAVRLVVEGSVRAAGWARPGSSVVLPFPARPAGRVAGYVEIDPDPLLDDNRRYFVVDVAAPAAVAVAAPQPFLEEAVAVLETAGRVRRVPVADARVVLAPGARSADAIRRGASVVVMPPATPLELGATNQRLAAAGIPWRYGPPAGREARLDTSGPGAATSLAEVRLRKVYALLGEGDSVALRLRGGEPWAVTGEPPGGGRFVLLASPLTAEGGTLPTSAAMVPFLDEVITGWAAGRREADALRPGALVAVSGDSVIGPDGVEAVRSGTVHRLRRPGIYSVVSNADTVAAYAVNAPPEESRLDRVPPDRLSDRLPGLPLTLAAPGQWDRTIFRDRLGRDVAPWLLLVALALLLVESAVAASGRSRPARPRPAGSSTVPAGDTAPGDRASVPTA